MDGLGSAFLTARARKVERVSKRDAQKDLDDLIALRATGATVEPRHERLATFEQVIDGWLDAGCPSVSSTSRTRHAREKSPSTIANARTLLDVHVRATIGGLRVDRTTTTRLEQLFQKMAASGLSTSTVDRTWLYVNHTCQHAVRQRLTKTNPAATVLLPVARPAKPRKSLTIVQAQALLTRGIPASSTPAMWITGLMCGLRPGELAGLRWPFVDIDSAEPSITVAERAQELAHTHPLGQGTLAETSTGAQVIDELPEREILLHTGTNLRGRLATTPLDIVPA